MNILATLKRFLAPRPSTPVRVRLRIEELESRVVPTTTGNAWPHPERITLSFVPDGTIIGTSGSNYVYSSLFAKLNSHPGWTTATWQNEIIKAAQAWAQQTNLNIDVVPDSGAPVGSGSYQQGDPQFGDIRIGGYVFGNTYLAAAYLPPPVDNYSIAGDVNFNTYYAWNIGTTYDLFSVAAHEIGHALGLAHSPTPSALMFPTYNGVKSAPANDDVSNIRAVYSGGAARSPDRYDAVASNDTFATATNLTAQIDPVALTTLQTGLDITSTGDPDYYTFAAPAGTSGTLTVNVQTAGLSLLRQSVTVYAANQSTVLGSASSPNVYDGTTDTVTVSGVAPGQVFYVKVTGADSTAFGTGAYALTLNFGAGSSPTVPLPNTQTPNGSPLQGGGGQNEGAPVVRGGVARSVPDSYETLEGPPGSAPAPVVAPSTDSTPAAPSGTTPAPAVPASGDTGATAAAVAPPSSETKSVVDVTLVVPAPLATGSGGRAGDLSATQVSVVISGAVAAPTSTQATPAGVVSLTAVGIAAVAATPGPPAAGSGASLNGPSAVQASLVISGARAPLTPAPATPAGVVSPPAVGTTPVAATPAPPAAGSGASLHGGGGGVLDQGDLPADNPPGPVEPTIGPPAGLSDVPVPGAGGADAILTPAVDGVFIQDLIPAGEARTERGTVEEAGAAVLSVAVSDPVALLGPAAVLGLALAVPVRGRGKPPEEEVRARRLLAS